MAHIEEMAEPYEAGYGYPAGRFEISFAPGELDGFTSVVGIQGFPTIEAAQEYALQAGWGALEEIQRAVEASQLLSAIGSHFA